MKKLKLLIVTQKVDINDDLLGFFHDWIKKLADYCEQIIVICLQRGEYDLPKNVKVLSLGKEEGVSRFKYIKKFYKYIWQERKNYDNVFVHMNKEYVILGGIFWRLWQKRIGFWYVHKRIGLKLRIAEKLTNVIFTASKESFKIKSKKVKVVGHGIDVEKFESKKLEVRSENKKFKIIYVGRISRIKNQELLIRAIDYLVNKQGIKNIRVDLTGSPVYENDEIYQIGLKELVQKKNLGPYINFIGSVPNKDMASVYNQADLSVNLCPTGGLDKAVLESMASGILVIALNKTFLNILKDFKDRLILENDDEKELAEKIKSLINLPPEERRETGQILREIVARYYSLDNLIKNILKNL